MFTKVINALMPYNWHINQFDQLSFIDIDYELNDNATNRQCMKIYFSADRYWQQVIKYHLKKYYDYYFLHHNQKQSLIQVF